MRGALFPLGFACERSWLLLEYIENVVPTVIERFVPGGRTYFFWYVAVLTCFILQPLLMPRDENASVAVLYLFLLLKVYGQKYTVFFLKSIFILRSQLVPEVIITPRSNSIIVYNLLNWAQK
jgi:hypothetical protein